MKYYKVLILACVSVILMGASPGCGSLKYEKDSQFLSAAEANSNEEFIFIQSQVCKNMHGRIGVCATDVMSDKPLTFHLDPRPYSYRLKVFCSDGVIDPNDPSKPWSHVVDIPKDSPHDFSILPESTSSLRAYKCKGRLLPDDRLNDLSSGFSVNVEILDAEKDECIKEDVSMDFSVSIEIVDAKYEPREQIYWEDGYLILGQHALHSTVCDEGYCQTYKKKTYVRASKDAIARSESEVMRMNYYGY